MFDTNNSKLNIKFLLWLPFLLLFFPSFCLPLKKAPITYFFISLIFVVFVFFIFKFKICLKRFLYFYKKSSYKYLVYWFLYVIFSTLFINIFSGNLNQLLFLKYVFFSLILPINYILILLNNKKSINSLLKIISIMFLIIFILGILSYASSYSTILESFFSFVVNKREILGKTATVEIAFRAFSTFAEPGWFAGYIVFNIPIILNLYLSKFKIFNNCKFDFFIKKILIILAYVNLVLTKSPINIVVGFIISGFCLYKYIKIFFLKHKILKFVLIYFCIVSFLFFLKTAVIYNNHTENPILKRSSIVLDSIKNKNIMFFLIKEESLASRILSYNAHIKLFFEHPLIGVGLSNEKYYMPIIFSKYNLPMTKELLSNYDNATNSAGMSINGAIFYELLSQTGLLGLILYFLFVYKLSCHLTKTSMIASGIYRDYISGLRNSLYVLCFYFSFYDMGIANTYTWFLFGIGIAISQIINKEKYNNIQLINQKEVI